MNPNIKQIAWLFDITESTDYLVEVQQWHSVFEAPDFQFPVGAVQRAAKYAGI